MVGCYSVVRAINPGFLKTLAREQLLSGFAEIIKHALIYDKNYWEELTNTPFENLIWEKVFFQDYFLE